MLPADARITGVDREAGWAAEAQARAASRGLAGRSTYPAWGSCLYSTYPRGDQAGARRG